MLGVISIGKARVQRPIPKIFADFMRAIIIVRNASCLITRKDCVLVFERLKSEAIYVTFCEILIDATFSRQEN